MNNNFYFFILTIFTTPNIIQTSSQANAPVIPRRKIVTFSEIPLQPIITSMQTIPSNRTIPHHVASNRIDQNHTNSRLPSYEESISILQYPTLQELLVKFRKE